MVGGTQGDLTSASGGQGESGVAGEGDIVSPASGVGAVVDIAYEELTAGGGGVTDSRPGIVIDLPDYSLLSSVPSQDVAILSVIFRNPLADSPGWGDASRMERVAFCCVRVFL